MALADRDHSKCSLGNRIYRRYVYLVPRVKYSCRPAELRRQPGERHHELLAVLLDMSQNLFQTPAQDIPNYRMYFDSTRTGRIPSKSLRIYAKYFDTVTAGLRRRHADHQEERDPARGGGDRAVGRALLGCIVLWNYATKRVFRGGRCGAFLIGEVIAKYMPARILASGLPPITAAVCWTVVL